MTTAVQRRRGTNTEHASFTGLEGEISVNTTNESVHVHDGSTAGGFELMRADGSNSSVSLGDITGVTAGTGLSGGGTTGTVTLDIDGTVATLAGTQTFTNKTLTSPILNTPTIGTSFTIGGATITEAELEILDGATVTTTELNYVDGVTSAIQTQIDAKAPLASPSFTGNISVGGTVDGRDVAADGTKLDGIEASADVTDTTNVTAAGALMDSEVTNLAQVKAFDSADYATAAQGTKVDGIEAGADVTDTANVTAAGALMDSELTSEASVKALNQGVATTDSPAFAGLTVDTDTLAVDSTNNRVGIGTTSPVSNLHINSTDTTASLQITNSATGSAETDGFHISVGSGGFTSLSVKESSGMSFILGGTERGRFGNTGIFLIGRTLTSTVAEDDGLVLNPNGLIVTARNGTGTNTHINFVNNAAVDATVVGTIKTSGSATSYNTSSDYRLKTDAQPMTGATDRLKALNPVNFEWISDCTRVDGFIAHEVADVVPEAISGDKDAVDEDNNPDYQGIDQSKLVPLLVATIQELEARITQLENS